jgi:predicted nuclease of predicted toxin-antitoxin system
MKILVDENIPRTTVTRLRELGHDVRDIRGSGDEGLADAALWAIAVREGRLLITTDKGFTEYRTTSHNGILVVRLRQPNRVKIHQSVMRAMDRFGEAEWPGLLVVMRDATMSRSRAGGWSERPL